MKSKIWIVAAILALSAIFIMSGCDKESEKTTASVNETEITEEATTVTTTTTNTTTTTTTTTIANANYFLSMGYNTFKTYCSGNVEEIGEYISVGQDHGAEAFKSELYPEYLIGYDYGEYDYDTPFTAANIEEGGYLNNEIYVGMTYQEILEKADYLSGISGTGSSLRYAAFAYIDGVYWGISFDIESDPATMEKLNNINNETGDLAYFSTDIDPAEFNPKSTFALYASGHSNDRNFSNNMSAASEIPLYISPDKTARVITNIPADDSLCLVTSYDNGWSSVKYEYSGLVCSGYVETASLKDIDVSKLDWEESYNYVFSNYDNCGFDPSLSFNGQYLHDIDGDSIPELIVSAQAGKTGIFKIYTWNETDGLVCKGDVNSCLGVMGMFNDDGTVALTSLDQYTGTLTFSKVDISGSEATCEAIGSSCASTGTTFDRASAFEEFEFSSADFSRYLEEWSN